jgi:BNR repeat-containing family member
VARTLGDGGWSWFGDPRAVYFAGRHRRTYVGWIDRGGDLTVASFDHRSRRVQRAVLRRGLSVDDHNSPGLLMRADGHLTVFYMGPGRAHMYYRRTREPEDVSSWGAERDLPTNTRGTLGYTYPNPMYLSEEGRTYLFWRGAQWWPAFSRHSDGNRWSDARTILRIPDQRPYLKFHSDGKRIIHVAYTEGNAGSFVNSIYYLRYRDGAFHRGDGTRVARIRDLPLRPSEGERVYDSRVDGVRAWVWDVAARRDGRPVIVYALFPPGQDCIYERAEFTDGQWERHPIVSAGGRIGHFYGDLAGPREPGRVLPVAQGRRPLCRAALAHGGPRRDVDAPHDRCRRAGRRLPAPDHAARARDRARRRLDAGQLPRLHRLPHRHPRALLALSPATAKKSLLAVDFTARRSSPG